ncbi:MAG: response regulator transcription factor [Actinomycetota bacterium]|nr:response regulator transcription factor [Actinomycetota bacterium]
MTGWAAKSSIRVLLLASSCGESIDEATALRAGASGLLLSSASPVELMAALRLVAAGYGLCTPSMIDKLGADGKVEIAPAQMPREFLHLTTREQQVFRLMATGAGNAEIARALTLRQSTVKSHVQHILTKLNLPNRVHAVIFAHKYGLMSTPVDVHGRPIVGGSISGSGAVA